ncbi:hypothetical protein MKZ38_007351 [Zalerion maritima]|uniref:Uncharacterized protein n=1 Tax=Zalerion maritima TaxID=339359 RepID=A0AAD5RWM6_9PEZI|nr:hypothetical protein MKZ38_007351 [Zalerion maritima]
MVSLGVKVSPRIRALLLALISLFFMLLLYRHVSWAQISMQPVPVEPNLVQEAGVGIDVAKEHNGKNQDHQDALEDNGNNETAHEGTDTKSSLSTATASPPLESEHANAAMTLKDSIAAVEETILIPKPESTNTEAASGAAEPAVDEKSTPPEPNPTPKDPKSDDKESKKPQSEESRLPDTADTPAEEEPNATTSIPQPRISLQTASEMKMNETMDTVELVVGKIKNEVTNWITDNLGHWNVSIYEVDDQNAELNVPMNKGHEAMVYLTYDSLPEYTIFHHSKQFQWHNDDPDSDSLTNLRRLQFPYIKENGYASLRCTTSIGCPAEIRPIDDAGKYLQELHCKGYWMDAYRMMFPGEPVPVVVGTPCCAQFAATRETILGRPKEDYERMRKWLFDTELKDGISGRVFEYLWHIIFGKEAVFCPDEDTCYCQLYGKCGDAWRKGEEEYRRKKNEQRRKEKERQRKEEERREKEKERKRKEEERRKKKEERRKKLEEERERKMKEQQEFEEGLRHYAQSSEEEEESDREKKKEKENDGGGKGEQHKNEGGGNNEEYRKKASKEAAEGIHPHPHKEPPPVEDEPPKEHPEVHPEELPVFQPGPGPGPEVSAGTAATPPSEPENQPDIEETDSEAEQPDS